MQYDTLIKKHIAQKTLETLFELLTIRGIPCDVVDWSLINNSSLIFFLNGKELFSIV